LLAQSPLRRIAEIIRTADGADLPYPTTDDTGQTGEYLTEGGAVSTQDVATGSLVLEAHKASSKIVKVSPELLQDSAINLPMLLGRLLGERVGRISNTKMTTGTGTNEPQGIVTGATLGITMASATALDPDEIVQMVFEIDPAYMEDPSVGWMMHNAIALKIALLRFDFGGGAGTGDYFWRPGLQAGEPDRLLGHPVYKNSAMVSALAIDAKAILFGALGKYVIREVTGVRLHHLVERYRDNDLDAFVMFVRNDGGVLDATGGGANAPIQYMQCAAA
jgi:HK97 family phage major capsid protein